MTLQQTGKLDKGWGYEIVWSNNDNYCGKLLVFDTAGSKTSMVFHKQHRKSWFVNAGKFKLTYCDTTTAEYKQLELIEGATFELLELQPHQLEALVDNSIIFEVVMPIM